MDVNANDLLLFARVVETGSFSRTAERMGLPKSTVSRRITQLEQQLGERLLARSTRQLALTEFGQGVLEYARRLVDEVDSAAAFAQYRQAKPRGRLRVSMPPDFSEKLVLTSFFLQFCSDYPEIQLDLDMSPRRVDLLSEQFDLAIRIAPSLPDDATLVARKLCELPGALYASQAYLARFGRPATPADLVRHTALHLVASNGEPQRWHLRRGAETWEGLPPGPLACNSMGLILQLAAHGLGMGLFTQRIAQPSVEMGLIERVLPDWISPPVTMWAVMPSRRLIPTRTRVFIDALEESLRANGGV